MSSSASDPSRSVPAVPAAPGDPDRARDADLGRRLAEAAIGIDRLERRLNHGDGPLDSEGLVPIWLGDDLVETPRLAVWEDADARLAALADDGAALPDGARRDFLTAMVASLQAAAELFRGAEMGYAEKLERLVNVPAAPVDAAVFEGLQSELDAALSGAGVDAGPLAERARRWQEARALDAEALPGVFRELMDAARGRTDARIHPVGDYDMRLRPLRGVPYTARCNFAEGEMDLNVDQAFSRAALKHLVAHEVFPGHSTQLLYTRDAVAAGSATPDALLCTVNGATGAVQEGIGDQGTQLIDWLEDDDDRVHAALRRLRSAGQASAAWFRMAEGWERERVRAWLRDEACGQPAWTEGRLRFAEHPFRGPFIASYWFGDEAVREVRERVAAHDDEAARREFVGFLYGRLNTPQSLRRFAPGAA